MGGATPKGTGSTKLMEMLNGHQKLLCKMEIFVITYDTINRKNEVREVMLTEQGWVVTGAADTKIALHQNTYVTTIYGLLRRRMTIIKCNKTEDGGRIHCLYTTQT